MRFSFAYARGLVLSLVISFAWIAPLHAANVYDNAANKGVTWLVQQRNSVDGSWGATDDVKYIQTSEAVLALAALNQLGAAYYGGVSWLDNHTSSNVDFAARRILTLGGAGASVNLELQALQAAQSLGASGNSGWGLAGIYQGTPLDTGLSLQALAQQNISANVPEAITFLAGSQLGGTDTGWALGQETTSDPVATAQVLIALASLRAAYPTSTLSTALSRGVTALNAKVNGASPSSVIALAVIANLRMNPTSTQATTLLNALIGQQAVDGSWGGDPYVTALALRALGAGLARDIAAQKQALDIPDDNLRAAINATLGHGALDAINNGQLLQLTALDASGRGIRDLTGLQGATNLTSLDLSNNQITSFAPVAGLTPNINQTGNPGYVAASGGGDTDVPTLPEWGAILMAALLLATLMRNQAARS